MRSTTTTSSSLSALVSRFIVPVIIILHLGITVTLSKILNVWIDEAYSLHTTGGNLEQILKQAIFFEDQPPFYFLLVGVWRNFNDSFFFARLFSVLCILLTLIVIAKISQRLFKSIHPGWLIAPVAFNPFIIWAAVEIRCYALVILLSTLLCLLFYEAYLSEKPAVGARWYYTLVSVFALYTFYFLGFLLVANAFSLLILKRWRYLRVYLVNMIIVAICFSPMIIMVINQVSSARTIVNTSVSILDGLNRARWIIIDYIIPDLGNFFITDRKWVLAIGGIMVLFLMFKKKGASFIPQNIAFLTTACILYILSSAFIIFLGEKNGFAHRHFLYLFPPLFFCLFSVLATTGGKRSVIICSLILLFFGTSSSIHKFSSTTKGGDWGRVASFIMVSEKPNQPILVYRSSSALPLSFHYSGMNEIIPLPKQMNLLNWDPDDFVLDNEMELSQIVLDVYGDYQQFWLVTDTIRAYRGVRFSHDLLYQFIDKYFFTTTKKDFFGSKVRFLRRKTIS